MVQVSTQVQTRIWLYRGTPNAQGICSVWCFQDRGLKVVLTLPGVGVGGRELGPSRTLHLKWYRHYHHYLARLGPSRTLLKYSGFVPWSSFSAVSWKLLALTTNLSVFSSKPESSQLLSSCYITHRACLQKALIKFPFLLTVKKAAVNLLGDEKKST